MCGRYVSKDQAAIERFSNLTRGGGDFFAARYNAAPTQRLPILRIHPERGPELVQLRWGLIPSRAKDTSIGSKMINARATLQTWILASSRQSAAPPQRHCPGGQLSSIATIHA
jgi:putative SOS response-associated peptidase YedK